MADSGIVTPGLAHVRGDTNHPLLETTIYSTYLAHALHLPQQTALVIHHRAECWPHEELLLRVDRIASGLSEVGFCKGDRIGVWMLNDGEWLVTQLASAKLGLIMVNLNPDYRMMELEYALNLVGCKGLIMVPEGVKSNYMAMIQTLCPELSQGRPILSSQRVPSLERVIMVGSVAVPGTLKFDNLYSNRSVPEQACSCDEAINIQFTSGTTGHPKASTLTHKGILNNAYFLGRTLHYTAKDIICVPVPLYHCFGCVMGNLAMVCFGCTLVYPALRFDPLATLQAVVDHDCTSLYGVPTMFISMLEHPKFHRFKFRALRTGIMAGALCPEDTMNRVISEMGAREVTIAYGMTETSPVSWQTRIGTDVKLTCSTIGQIHPHVECKVVNPDTLEVLPFDTPGELLIAGYGVMLGYWGNDEATTSSIPTINGKRWMRTGDLALISGNGFGQIVGRIKDMILRGGECIYPKELEMTLMEIPMVVNASVIGVPDHLMGEQVCAWIQWKGGAPIGEAAKVAQDEIRAHLEGYVAHYKIPKYIVFKDAFPMTVTGKIRKVEMREVSTQELMLAPPTSKL